MLAAVCVRVDNAGARKAPDARRPPISPARRLHRRGVVTVAQRHRAGAAGGGGGVGGVRGRLHAEPVRGGRAVDVTAGRRRREHGRVGHERLPQPAPARHEVHRRRPQVGISSSRIVIM